MLAALVVVATVAVDPRIELVTLAQEGKLREQTKVAERALRNAPEEARAAGIDYLLGRLLERSGRSREAVGIYAQVMRSSPLLKPYAVLRVAAIQTQMGHPELSSGLLVSLLERPPPPALLRPAERELLRALDRGGDCRVLEDLALESLPPSTRRRLVLARLECEPSTDRERAAALFELLREDNTDLVASLAASRLANLPRLDLDAEESAILGASLHHHREFELAEPHLRSAVRELPHQLDHRAEVDTLYLLLRSWFWNGELDRAATGFGDLAERTRRPEDRARALYQEGRCFELRGEWTTASSSYRRSYLADPEGRFAGAALISALRVEWRTGHESQALEIYDLLPARRDWRSEAARAALYLASSDLVRRRGDRAGSWLRQAEISTGRDSVEIDYWRAVWDELRGEADGAVDHYLDATAIDPYHPLAVLAAERLREPARRRRAEARAVELSTSSRARDQVAAWLLLGDVHPAGGAARARLAERANAHRHLRELVASTLVPTAAWPLWQANLSSAEETLLALGLWDEAGAAALQHFPVSRPALALTAAEGLYRSGDLRRSIRIAEILAERTAGQLPEGMWPLWLRQRQHPLPYAEAVSRAAAARGIDRALLFAILREESRFDPEAVSKAAARGMAQFVLPTAREVGRRAGIGEITAEDLSDPAISIELAAAHLAELLERFGGSEAAAVAAYNAGERQSALWQAHCYGRDDAELITKVSFGETRFYVERVLGARARYAELYPQSTDGRPVTAPASGGIAGATTQGQPATGPGAGAVAP